MKLFVTGGTGVLGRGVLPRLVADGHVVHALARSDASAAALTGVGVTPVRADLFDPGAIAAAVRGSDGVLHLATKIPAARQALRASAWAENDRIRTEGTRLLVDAALAGGAGLFVYQSVTFGYADGADRWLDEDAPLDISARLASSYAGEVEIRRVDDAGGRAVTLRGAWFYGPDSSSTTTAVSAARRGVALVFGALGGYLPVLHTDDAATAFAAAVHAPAGVYNVTDDAPLTRSAHRDAMQEALGCGRLRALPRFAAGRPGAYLARSQRVSNARFREATGWTPCFADAAVGWRHVASVLGERSPAPRVRRGGEDAARA